MKYNTDGLEFIGGNNQKVYLTGDVHNDSVIKVLEDDFHCDGPHSHWSVGERLDASVDAHNKYPHLFPAARKVADDAIKQDYVSGGITFGKALKNGYVDSLTEILGNLKEIHKDGYVHGDFKGDNIRTGILSVDTETFGLGDYRHDLTKARKIAGRHGKTELFDNVISEVYGEINLN